MDIVAICKENKWFDIAYRFSLWFLVAYVLFSLSKALEGIGGEYLRNAISVPPSSSFTQIIGLLGLVIGGIALIVKEINICHTNESSLSFCISKVSTDLVLAPFNIMSFGLGWGFFLYTEGSLEGENVSLLGILLVPYLAIMIFLALTSLAIRAQPGEFIYRKFYSQTRLVRVLIALVIIGATLYAALFHGNLKS